MGADPRQGVSALMGQIKPILPMMTPREAAAILAVGTEDSDAGTYLHRVRVSYRVGF